MSWRSAASTFAVISAALLVAACGGGSKSTPPTGPGSVSGIVVVNGPVVGATVTAYQLDGTMQRTGVLVAGATAADGTFSLSIPAYNGALELAATGGTYADAVRRTTGGDPLPLSVSRELSYVVASYSAGAGLHVTLSPVSTVARSLTKGYLATRAFPVAVTDGWACANSHFGAIQWQSVTPLSLPSRDPVPASMSDASTKAGLILAAFSQVGKTLAPTTTLVTGVTFGGSVAQDAQDGLLDGKLNGAPLVTGLGGSPSLTSYSTRTDLAQALYDYVASPANTTGLTQTDVYPLASALALDANVCAFSASMPPNADTGAPMPHLSATPPPAYYDERDMTLVDGTVPARVRFPIAASKIALVADTHVYKASTRLTSADVTAADLEGTNAANIPFLRISITRGAASAPLTAATWEISDGTYTTTGDLRRWAVAGSMGEFDLPIAAYVGTTAIVPSLATAETTPSTLIVKVSAADAAGLTVDPVAVATVHFHVIAAPLYVAEDVNYPLQADSSSTYGYSAAAHNFDQMWNTGNTAFVGGQVRLVRYVVSNPFSAPVAVRATFDNGPGGWKSIETWQRFTAAPMPDSVALDGFVFAHVYCDYWSGPGSCSTPQLRDPCGHGAPFWHVNGSTQTQWVCSGYYPQSAYDGTQAPFAATASEGGGEVGVFAAGSGVETIHPTQAGSYFIVPPAAGGVPGTVVVYVTRAASQGRWWPTLAWNQFTTNNRFEALEVLAWVMTYEVDTHGSYPNLHMDQFTGIRGAAYLQSVAEHLDGVAQFYSRPVIGTNPVLTEAATFASTVSRVLSTH